MKKKFKFNRCAQVALLGFGLWSGLGEAVASQDEGFFVPPDADSEAQSAVSDPLEPWNRLWFGFNDGLYEIVLKPVAQGYSAVIPEGGRVAVSDFFHNLLMPVRLANSLLQGKGEQALVEVERFGINTVMGGLGFIDVAKIHFQLKRNDEDLGQTLAVYGVGDGFYLVWPVLGPSNVRDTLGKVGDHFITPLSYVPEDEWARVGVDTFQRLNKTSLWMDDYDKMKATSLDPYVAARHAYISHRDEKISR